MTHFPDDLYLGGFSIASGPLIPKRSSGADPTINQGVGPMGRSAFLNILPLALSQVNLAALQASVNGAALVLAAGAGVTVGQAPDSSGVTVYQFDVERCVSLTSLSNLSAINYLITGYDFYGRKATQLLTGPNANTVNTKKAFQSVSSIVAQGASANTISAGSSDIFGLPFLIADAGFIMSVKWANALAQNAGTFVAGDQTNPATNLTGDTQGTFAPAGAASNGANRLVVEMHLNETQCGFNATVAAAFGVTPA